MNTQRTFHEEPVQRLTAGANETVRQLAQRYGVSSDAVTTLLSAVSAGSGSMAQFSHPELGGSGQWMRGGMTMVGDMFNRSLQATVSGLCSDLSELLASQQVFLDPPSRSSGGSGFGNGNVWWPAELGNPSSSGRQNDHRYAYFAQAQRLAIDRGGRISLYNTLEHRIGGVQQQQGGGGGSLSFTSQLGTFTVDSLPLAGEPFSHDASIPAEASRKDSGTQARAAQQDADGGSRSHDEILGTLERLSDLHQRGVVSEEEFRSKKGELLSRL